MTLISRAGLFNKFQSLLGGDCNKQHNVHKMRETSVVLWMCLLLIDCRQLNITNLENCQELDQEAVVRLKTISYHVVPETGVCDTVHGELEVKSADYKPRLLTITLYKCSDPQSSEVCLENAAFHEETLGCDRLIGDDSGPWAMFSDSIIRSNCGKSTGVFSVDYSTLKLHNLIYYLDTGHAEFSRFRLRMHFWSTQTNSLRACVDLDFKLFS